MKPVEKHGKTGRGRLGAALALGLLLVPGCGLHGARTRDEPREVVVGEARDSDIAPFQAANRPAYLEALRRARVWLDDLDVDPLQLRTQGIKGKKKLVEHLSSYYRLWKVADSREQERLLERIKQVVAVTYEQRYHDMASISDEWFKQDATSYLRAALLMERLGLDTQQYRQEIDKIHGRLNSHMNQRGPNQRRTFHWYYRHFGLKEPFPLEGALEHGIIAARRDATTLSSMQVYSLTHEVYALYEYGDRLDVDPFTDDEKVYLRHALEVLTERYIERRNPDLLAEVLECMHYLRFSEDPAFRAGLSFLLADQNQDGAWGRYARQRQRLGDYVRHGFELHTTLVVIGALTAAFDMPMPESPSAR